jgi:purine-binding chemotaxis protein CheW
MDKKYNMLRFLVQEVRLCLDLSYLKKIFLLPTLEQLLGCSFYTAGIINISGNSVPVIDLTLRLKLERDKPYTLDTSVLLCENAHQEMAFIVDQVMDIKTIEKNAIQMETPFQDTENFFQGTVLINEELNLILNVKNIMNNSCIYLHNITHEQTI